MQAFTHFFSVPLLRSKRLVIRGVGVQQAVPACVVNRPRGSGDYLLMYFHDPVWLAASELPGHGGAGTLMIWTPGRWQYYGDHEKAFRCSWLHCDGAMVRDLLADSGLPLDEPISLADAQVVDRHLSAIHDELRTQARPDPMIVRNLLDNLLRQIARAVKASAARRPAVPASMLEVRNLIETEYERRLSLRELARRAGYSASRFCELFRECFSSGALEYLLQHRMHRAAYLLRDRNLTVKAVAAQVGYGRDADVFSKLFKKHFGMTPTAFRAQEPREGMDFIAEPAVGAGGRR